jgi:hypothetical protein
LKWNPPRRPTIAEVDEAPGALTGVLGEQQRRSPIGVHGRVERRLVGLVLGEHPPSRRQRVVDLAQTCADALELAAEVSLPGMVGAVGEPHRERRRAQLLTELDAVEVVLDGALAHVGRCMGERAELVADLATAGRRGVVLERVRVHRVEADAELVGIGAQRRRVVGIVPGDVQAHRSVCPGHGVERGDVVELLDRVARLAAGRETAEASPPGADRPRRRGDVEALHLGDDRLDVDVPAGEVLGTGVEVGPMAWRPLAFDLGHRLGSDSHRHRPTPYLQPPISTEEWGHSCPDLAVEIGVGSVS